MANAAYTDHGNEIAALDAEINHCCIAHDTAGAMKALTARRALEAAIKTGVVVVAALAFLPALASAAPAKHKQLAAAAAQFKAGEQQLYQTGSLPTATTLKVTCHGTAKRIICTGSANATYGAYKYTETFTVASGKLSSINGLVPVMPSNAPMARTASTTRVIDTHSTNIPDLRDAVAMSDCDLGNATSELLAVVHPYGRVSASADHAFTPTMPLGEYGVLDASLTIHDGIDYTFKTVCMSRTGRIFDLVQTQKEYPTRMVVVATAGAWVGPGKHHGTWSYLGHGAYSMTTA